MVNVNGNFQNQESANWGFGDECEDNSFMERQPEFCNVY